MSASIETITIQDNSLASSRVEIIPVKEAMRRLAIVGCVDLRYATNGGRTPTPLFRIDDGIEPEHFRLTNRTRHYLAYPATPDTLLRRSYQGQVDVGEGSREGFVYLGKARFTTGHLLDTPIPFDPDMTLSYVENPDGLPVHLARIIGGTEASLVYSSLTHILDLSPLALPSR